MVVLGGVAFHYEHGTPVSLSITRLAQNLRRIANRFQGVFVFEAHRLLYRSTLGSRVIKKMNSNLKDVRQVCEWVGVCGDGRREGREACDDGNVVHTHTNTHTQRDRERV